MVICPGSRSTPIALAFAKRAGDVAQWVLYDERSAAFFALGVAKSSRSPVAVVTTSGTAAANLLPAMAEAKLGRAPLVAVTADRPPESRDFGGAQTIDQVDLFGSHTKWSQDVPVAADLGSLRRYSRIVGARASHTAGSTPQGPVHINFSFREPLLSGSFAAARPGNRDEAVAVVGAKALADEGRLRDIADKLRSREKGVILVGPGDYDEGVREGLSNLSGRLGWPILADVLSNLRQEGAVNEGVVRCYEPLVRSDSFASHKPECVLRVGAVPTSKELNLFCQGATTIVLDDAEGWRDPDFGASVFVFGELEHSLRSLGKALEGGTAPRTDWRRLWESAAADAEARMDSMLEAVTEPFEGKLFHLVSNTVRPQTPLTLVVGSSMPVRDLDYFFLRGSRNIRLLANRGANGIDGVVSTAMGVSAVEGDVLLILGDVSFYHDTNGLLSSGLYHLNATVVVVNNKGGGIFSFLPQRSLPSDLFERLFGEAHDIDFSGVRALYGGEFSRVSDWAGFERALDSSMRKKGLKVIELMAEDRERNVELHKEVFKALSSSKGEEVQT